MAKKVNIQSAPDSYTRPEVRFSKNDFEIAIWRHGYDVYHDKMIKCPCSGEVGQPLVTCKNCIGSGWVLIERVETKMMLQSISLDTKIKDWTEEKAGTIKITCLDKDKLSYMDRVIVLRGEATANELLKIRTVTVGAVTTKFAYSIYEIVSIFNIFLFDGDNNVLKQLIESVDFAFEGNKIILGSDFNLNSDVRISLKYKYRPQFHVIDIARDTITQDNRDIDTGVRTSNEQFPLYAIGRRSHYVLDVQNYNQTLILDNVGNELTAPYFDIRLRPSLYGTGNPPSPSGIAEGVIYYKYTN